jgi:hypothetical protein
MALPKFPNSPRAVEQSIKAGRILDSVMLEINSLIDLIRRIDGHDESKGTVAIEEPVK